MPGGSVVLVEIILFVEEETILPAEEDDEGTPVVVRDEDPFFEDVLLCRLCSFSLVRLLDTDFVCFVAVAVLTVAVVVDEDEAAGVADAAVGVTVWPLGNGVRGCVSGEIQM